MTKAISTPDLVAQSIISQELGRRASPQQLKYDVSDSPTTMGLNFTELFCPVAFSSDFAATLIGRYS